MGALNLGYIVTIYVALTKILNVSGSAYSTDLARLHHSLFSAVYSSDVIPLSSHDRPIVVKMFPVIVKLDNGMAPGDDLESTFSVTMVWRDYRLRWAPVDYNNINQIYVPLKNLWRPDLTVHNAGQGHNEKLFDENDLAVVSHSGLVTYGRIINLKFLCSVDYFEFPFDKSQCYLTIGSWLYSAMQIKLEFLYTNETSIPIDFRAEDTRTSSASEDMGQWKLVHEKAQGVLKNITHACCPDDPSAVLEIIMHVRRSPGWKGTILVLLVIVSAILIPIQFCISPNVDSRLTHGYMSLLVSCFSAAFLIYLMPASQIPTTKIGISMAGYVSMSIVAVVASITVKAYSQNYKDDRPPSACLVQIATLLSPICSVKTGTKFPRNRQKPSNPYMPADRLTSEYRPESVPLQGGIERNRSMDPCTNDGASERQLDGSSLCGKLNSIENKLTSLLEFVYNKQHGDWLVVTAVVDRILLFVFTILSIIFIINALR